MLLDPLDNTVTLSELRIPGKVPTSLRRRRLKTSLCPYLPANVTIPTSLCQCRHVVSLCHCHYAKVTMSILPCHDNMSLSLYVNVIISYHCI